MLPLFDLVECWRRRRSRLGGVKPCRFRHREMARLQASLGQRHHGRSGVFRQLRLETAKSAASLVNVTKIQVAADPIWEFSSLQAFSAKSGYVERSLRGVHCQGIHREWKNDA